jgi:hypothetical protein
MMIPELKAMFVDEMEKELSEREEQLAILKERLKAAVRDRDVFLKKLEEMEN